ncbi:MAG TPA: class II aldolase/adducin family protein [Sphaerochaeta sp.]|nr:class II aldolase/adducin family protein [Sphaerochaeta sp.]
MKLEQAKDAVMEASKQLVALGLVARTWGNVSCKVGEGHFLITPSGKPYEHLTKDQLVLVSLEDLSYPKGVKPSSEKKLHREVYKQKKDVECVIHTHQEMASLAGLLGKNIPVSKQGRLLLGDTIPAARYGLPGTKTLVKNAGAVIAGNNVTSALLANHGSLCFGRNETETLAIAKQLEVECKAYLTKLVPLFGEEGEDKGETHLILTEESSAIQPQQIQNKDTIQETILKEVTKVASLLQENDDQIKSILFHTSPAVLAVSRKLDKLSSYLDDFAQIAGAKIPIVEADVARSRLIQGGKKYNALLIRDVGALCWATTMSDAEAVVMILEKNCKAALLALEDSSVKPIGWVDTHLMRLVYQKKYSKIAQS